MERKVIDNFLSEEDFDWISSIATGQSPKLPQFRGREGSLPYYPQPIVSHDDDQEVNGPWNWMATSMLYWKNRPRHGFYDDIADTLLKKIHEDVQRIRAVIRVKANFYGHTEEVRAHRYHIDLDYDNYGAIFSLNTCNGYTEFEDGQKVDSVENRLLIFNAHDYHRSTTTSSAFGRYNININFL